MVRERPILNIFKNTFVRQLCGTIDSDDPWRRELRTMFQLGGCRIPAKYIWLRLAEELNLDVFDRSKEYFSSIFHSEVF